MNRPKDPAIRQRLLDAAVQYVLHHGVGGLSLRPMAKHMGTTARMLMHHFGSKEALVAEVLLALEQGFAERTAAYIGGNDSVSFTLSRMWSETAAPVMEPALRAMFEVWGHALVHPTLYRSFLASLTEPWINLLQRQLLRCGRKAAEATVLATLAVGAFQGLHLVRLTSGDDDRSEKALHTLVRWLDPDLTRKSSRPKGKRSQ
ncbi:MAG TPA: TetR/AcrR family transcriptional regulator [Steroidobacteraceae bacterium]